MTMDLTIEAVLDGDAADLKCLVATVIAESVTRAEPIHSEMVANAQGNVDRWTEHHSGVHLKALAAGQILGVVLVKNHWNLCSLFVAPSVQRQGVGGCLLSAAIAECSGKSPRGRFCSIPHLQRLRSTLNMGSCAESQPVGAAARL
jgi:GNAT superfamily N-acetyltransferase